MDVVAPDEYDKTEEWIKIKRELQQQQRKEKSQEKKVN